MGCAALAPQQEQKAVPKADSPGKAKLTLGQKLLAQDKALKQDTLDLKKRINELEQQRTADQESILSLEKRLKNMTHTINLMELSVKDLQGQYVSELSSTAAKSPKLSSLPLPTADIAPEQISSLEVQTPTHSKAIEEFTLVSLTPSPIKKSVVKKKRPPLVIAKQVKKDKKENQEIFQSWEDPDLSAPSAPMPLVINPGAKILYKKAFKSYTLRNYQEAIKGFESLLTRYPNDQDADNSQFWIGQAYFQLGDLLQSEHAFRKVLRNYAHGETRRGYKTPDAILMLGRVYLARNKPIKARNYFEQVIKKFPKSRSADKAGREVESTNAF